MEVSHASTEARSASLGITAKGQRARVTTDTEFMMSLAHGIYTNKPLALVRELICNARDAHIAKGTPDVPIVITITDNSLVIRDYGTGIPLDIFADVYLVFGDSTKKKKANQTGGFGVGSKVPWAVCDTFSVRNFRDNKMTAFTIMKSDPAEDGEPSCTPVMTIDSIEPTGLEVTVPFPDDLCRHITRYVRIFADELGIPVNLNGTIQPVSVSIDNDALYKDGFVVLNESPNSVAADSSQFYVRLGDVIYPIEDRDEYADALNMLVAVKNNYRQAYLFLAEPNTLVPVMSREGLSYTAQGIAAIRDLMVKAIQALADNIDDCAQLIVERLAPVYSDSPHFIHEMWHRQKNLGREVFKLSSELTLKFPNIPADHRQLLLNNMSRWFTGSMPYMETAVTKASDVRKNVSSQLEALFFDALKILEYHETEAVIDVWKRKADSGYAYGISDLERFTYYDAKFWRSEIAEHQNVMDVLVCDSTRKFAWYGDNKSPPAKAFKSYSELAGFDDKKHKIFEYEKELNQHVYTSNHVVLIPTWTKLLIRNKEAFQDTLHWKNIFSDSAHANLLGARIVRLRPTIKPDEIAKLKLRYETYGWKVTVLDKPSKGEIAHREELAAARADTPPPTIPSLGELIYERTTYRGQLRKHLRALLSNKEFKGEPLYVILEKGKTLHYSLNDFETFKKLAHLVGTDITAVSTKTEIAKVLKEGRRSLEDALLDVAKQFYSLPDMHEKMFYNGTFFVKRVKQNRFLTQYLFNRTPKVFTEKEAAIKTTLLDLSRGFPKLSVYLHKRAKAYTRCSPAEHYEKLFEDATEERFVDVRRALDVAYRPSPSPQRKLARDILKNLLKERPA